MDLKEISKEMSHDIIFHIYNKHKNLSLSMNYKQFLHNRYI